LAALPVRAAEARVLRIAYLKGTNDLTLAKAHGSLEAALAPQGMRVQWAGPFPAAAPAVEAMAAGAVDLTVGSSTSFIASRAAGVKLVLFGYQRMSPGAEAILVATDSPLHTVRDLVGRSVAVNRGGSGEYLLVRALTRVGVPLDAVKRVFLSPPDASAAFARGAVDGWATWDPFLSIALSQGNARVLADGGESGSENAIAYFIGEDFLSAHRPVVQAILAVLEQENAWARAHPNDAGAIWAQELGLPQALGPRLGANNTPLTGPVGPNERQQIERIADWYVANKIVPSRPEIARYLVDLKVSIR
jgi:sulfonate transport system substrate-binding protein